MSIKSRLSQIKAQAQPHLMSRTPCTWGKVNGHPYIVIAMRSLTDEATNYEVKMVYMGKERFQDVEYQVVQNWNCSDGMNHKCKGADKTVCRHFAAAFLWTNEKKNKEVHFFDNFTNAFRYSNFGGKLVKLVSSGHEAWAVVTAKEVVKETSRRERMAERVNLMRGPVEEGIE